MLTAFAALLGGLIMLVIASDWLVDGAVSIAGRLGIPTLVVGMTIVAYGTSLPEFVVSVIASHRGVVDFAIGNIIGSNVANIGLVLGAVALVAPFAVQSRLLFVRDLPLLGLVTCLSVLFFLDDLVQRWEGGLLLVIALFFTVLNLRSPGEPEDDTVEEEIEEENPATIGKAVVLLLIGFAGLMTGAHFMVEGGTAIAKSFGISERVIGLTIVAIGTSLPELAASVAGAVKGHPALAVGNVVGSCLFNLAFVLGAVATIQPIPTDFSAILWDLVVMGGLTVLMWLLLRTGRRLTRGEGATLLLIYAGFLGYLVVTTARTMNGAA